MEPCLPILEADVIIAEHAFRDPARRKNRKADRPFTVPSYQKRLLVLCALLSFTLSPPLRATAVSVLIFPDRIFFATDGQRRGSEGGQVRTMSVCKSDVINGWLFLASGTVVLNDFELSAVAHRVLGRDRNAQDPMTALTSEILRIFPTLLPAIRNSQPEQFARLTRGLPILTILMGHVENKFATAIQCEFHVTNGGTMADPTCNTWRPKYGYVKWTGFGYSDASKQATQTGALKLTDDTGPIPYLRKAIQIEIGAARREHRLDVGRPITVGVFDSDGLHYIEPGACVARNR